MAKLGTKQRPAIVRVRTEARAQEIASIFTEHGWQFILGIEPDKPENISDLKRLLKSQKVPKAKKVGAQTISRKARKSHPRRKNNPPLRTVHTGSKKKELSPGSRKVSEEAVEYAPDMGKIKFQAIATCALSIFFLVKFFTTTSLWYVVFLVFPLLYFFSLMNAIILNQRVILHGRKITILRRRQTRITANVADSLYQIIVKKGTRRSFRFRFDNGRRLAQITPQVYKNGDKLLQQLEDIIDQENIDVDIIER